jgi:hypothetical protein
MTKDDLLSWISSQRVEKDQECTKKRINYSSVENGIFIRVFPKSGRLILSQLLVQIYQIEISLRSLEILWEIITGKEELEFDEPDMPSYSSILASRPLRPHHKLKRIEKRLIPEINKFDPFEINTKFSKAKNKLFDYCEKCMPDILKEYGLSRKDLETLYHKLLRARAGQWANEHWIAASALAYPNTLRFVIESEKNGESIESTASKLIFYFIDGEPLKYGE